MANDPSVFYIGLNMSGAVSAGAYTAGVMDFLVDALDTWYAARADQQAAHGDDWNQWNIPAHEVRLGVMSGASAGGMVSAISAAALCQDFTPARAIPHTSVSPNNPLYKAWVVDIDAEFLFGNRDLNAPGASLISLLDSSRIDEIAADALLIKSPRAQRRPWVQERLKVVLTLTNLAGVPYAIENDSAETQTLYHADQRDFEVRWDSNGVPGRAMPLTPRSASNWDQLALTAKATGAFPLVLASRPMLRVAGEYNHRLWRLDVDKPQCSEGACQCEEYQEMLPNWPARQDDGKSFTTLNVDGGVTNNSPFECAHRELTLLPPAHPSGHNPRSPQLADRAVINVAPFLSTPEYNMDQPPDANLLAVAGKLVSVLINQSRIQGENIKLTQNPNVASRYAIAPSIDLATVKALASATLGAFGGFLAREFRDHDYQLGRRNCQRFLERHFVLPPDNAVLKQYLPTSPIALNRILDQWGVSQTDGTKWLPVIPLIGDLQNEVVSDRASAAIDRHRLEPLASAAVDRLQLVADRVLSDSHAGWIPKTALKAVWLFAKGRLKDKLLMKMGEELASEGLIL